MTQLKVQDITSQPYEGTNPNQELSEWLADNNIVPSWIVMRQPEGLPTWDKGQFTALVFDFDQDGQKVLVRNPVTGHLKVDDRQDVILKTHVETLPCPKAPPVSLHV